MDGLDGLDGFCGCLRGRAPLHPHTRARTNNRTHAYTQGTLLSLRESSKPSKLLTRALDSRPGSRRLQRGGVSVIERVRAWLLTRLVRSIVGQALDAPAHFATVDVGLAGHAHDIHELSTSPYVARAHHAGVPPESPSKSFGGVGRI